jgi:hypothetical protein
MASYQAMTTLLSDKSTGWRMPDGKRLLVGGIVLLLMAAAGLISVSAVSMYGMWWSIDHLAPVKAGMTEAEVRAVAGRPRAVGSQENGAEYWSYTRWWSADADVYFDETRRVRAVVTD